MDKKAKRKCKNKKSTTEKITFGKLNVTKYFLYEKDTIVNRFPNYNNITVKKTKHANFKICSICYNYSNYTCPKCLDKYCSKTCFKTHIESKCTKYMDM